MSIIIDGKDFVINKGILRTLSLRNDIIDDIGNPKSVLRHIRETNLPVDILIFSQRLPDVSPKFPYQMEWDNLAAVKISTYENWLKQQIHPNARNKINKAKRNGVIIKIEELSKQLSQGILDIFNETAVRRGKRYPYFGRNVETVEKEWSADAGRNLFLVAYFQNEIIGFIQMVFGKEIARTSGTVAKLAHRDKSPMNALIAKAVEICSEKKISYLVYGKYTYGKKGGDSLTEFKRNNGFQQVEIPKYYVPLSYRGRIGIVLGLHHGFSEWMPFRLHNMFTRFRSVWYERFG